MSKVGEKEVRTQRRVIAFFENALGYAHLGHWQDRDGNSNVEEALLDGWLERSTVSVTEGIRQNLDSQKKNFIQPFYSTVQLVLAGNETEGLRYGVIETPEKYWLRWKEADAHPAAGDNPLLRELGRLCGKERLLEIVHDFLVFDAGIKKICRHNQYFGVRAAEARVKRREGGIVWHTQGSGKSLIMVWLAKWEPKVGVAVSEVRIKKMKTRWGSCNSKARRIWLNLELAKKPALCLEYILVHEMVHFLERHHDERFRELMDAVMPSWRLCREELNRAPLAHEEWRY